MFSIMKKDSTGSADIETVIGKGTCIQGNISGEGTIRIDGKLTGELEIRGDIVIGTQAEVTAQVKAKNLLISGIVRGNVVVEEKLEILGTGKLYGDVKAKLLSITEGGVFKGNSDMDFGEKLPHKNSKANGKDGQ